MKVTHFYAGNMFGGIETTLLNFQRYASECSAIEPSFVLCFEGTLERSLRQAGARLGLIEPPSFRKPWTILKARRQLKKELERLRPNIVVCHELWNYAIGAPVARALGLPVVLWHHNPPSISKLRYYVKLARPDLALTCSRYVAENMNGLVPPALVRPCPSPSPAPDPVHHRRRKQTRARYGAAAEDIVILCVTRLSAYKGQGVLIEAAADLKDLPFRVWITGRPSNAREAAFLVSLKERATELGISERVTFLGFVDDARDLYAAADVYCQPNIEPEPYGVTFIEALHAGLPVISTGIGGSSEILVAGGESYGFLVPPRDVESLAKTLRQLVLSRELRERHAALGPLRARDIGDPRLCLEKLAGFLSEAVAQRARASR